MSKQKKAQTETRIAVDRIVFGGHARAPTATTIPDPNYTKPPESEYGNVVYVVQKHLYLWSIVVEKVVPKGRQYLVRIFLHGVDGFAPPPPPDKIPQIRDFVKDVHGQYFSAQTELVSAGSRSFMINITINANRNINFIRHAAQIAKCACDHLGVDLAPKYTIDKWTDQRKKVSWLHLNRHERKTEFLYKEKWIPEKEYFDLYISEMLGSEIVVFTK